MDDNDTAGWAYQEELEHQQWLKFGYPDGREVEKYEDKHGV